MRKGQISDVMITLIVFVLFAEVFGVAVLGGMIAEKTVSKTGEIYLKNVAGIDVLEPSCATESRGVFYRSAIESESFGCLNPPRPVYFRFEFSDEVYQWRVGGEEKQTPNPTYLNTYN
ncbi:MAG: hypothetical protein SVS85_00755, partial [Candidatus Nanohaloarchaea archaeon]|nr:hypothetical protein [Candidatus Nanohaloarchaea archaeon]